MKKEIKKFENGDEVEVFEVDFENGETIEESIESYFDHLSKLIKGEEE